jgi:shikimate dehydrogenase
MTNPAVLALLGNAPDLGAAPRYAAIIGQRPSQGARSPSLWNAAFTASNVPVKFHPFDVDAAALAPVVDALRQDPRFIGGSVAVPYKSAIVPLLDKVEPVAGRIGAVNALYRESSALVGTNTDGQAALAILRAKLGVDRIQSRDVAIIGAGGTGAAVASYIAEDLQASGRLLLSNRDRHKAEELAARLGGSVEVIDWPPRPEQLKGIDILINCTSAGFAPGPDADANPNRTVTALSAAIDSADNANESIAALRALSSDCLVFDVVYQPRDTMLLSLVERLGLQTIGGLAMNLEQAVIAFGKAVPEVPIDIVRTIMAKVP